MKQFGLSFLCLFLCCYPCLAALNPVQEISDSQPIQNEYIYGIPFTFGPQPDTCSQKLQNLKENLDQKADFESLDLQHYSYDIQSICFLCGFKTIEVSVCENESSVVPEAFEDVSTIKQLFDFISDVIMRADGVKVEYDEELHFPTKVFVDFLAAGLDDGITYEITNFQILSQDTCVV